MLTCRFAVLVKTELKAKVNTLVGEEIFNDETVEGRAEATMDDE